MSSPVIEKLDEFGRAVHSMRKSYDEQYAKLESKNAMLESRMETVEALADRPRAGSTNEEAGTRDEREQKSRFLNWIRRPHDHQTKSILSEAQSELEKKAVAISPDSAGGYAVPELIARNVEEKVRAQNPFRQLVEVVQVGSSDFKKLVSRNDMTSGWVGEAG